VNFAPIYSQEILRYSEEDWYLISKQELIEFENEIGDLFLDGRIKAPIHLHGNNEDSLIEIFEQIGYEDWVFSTHRSQYHALLKGIPPLQVKDEILKGNSICLNFPEYRFYTSAIVAGIVPIAVGVAMAGYKCWVFVGDMASETGNFHECVKYATGHNLPIKFIVENNHFSVDTPTEKVWRYSYDRKYPHQGVGNYVIFG